MSDHVTRYEDLEQTDVLPQLGFTAAAADPEEKRDKPAIAGPRAMHPDALLSSAVLANTRALQKSNTAVHAMPAKPLPMALEVGGIRGKISDLEARLLEAQERKADLNKQLQQIEHRARESEERAIKAEANQVLQSSDLYRATQRATDAEQRLIEQRVQLEAQIATLERQIVDAKSRSEQRAAQLEQSLHREAERAALVERESGALKRDVERLRADLTTAQASIESLQDRVATQTRTAAEMSQLYAQQTAQAEAFSATMAENQSKLSALQAAKLEGEDLIATLQRHTREASEQLARLETELGQQRSFAATLEQTLRVRDRSLTELQAQLEGRDASISELLSVKAELASTREELRSELSAARAVVLERQEEATRLLAVLKQQETRIGELESANASANRTVQDREAAIVAEQARVLAAEERYAAANLDIRALRQRLEKQEEDIDTLQDNVQARSAELSQSRAEVAALQRLQAAATEERGVQATALSDFRTQLRHVEAERDQLDLDHRAARADLAVAQERYDEVVEAIVVAREGIAMRDQRNTSLEHELRTVAMRLDEANGRAKHSAAMADKLNLELQDRDGKIAALEQKLSEHMSALSAIGQDIERVNATHPSEGFATLGYTLEDLTHAGVVHRLTRAITSVGRSDSNDIAIDSTSVSRYHARLLVKPEGVWLVDLQSTNGCGVNGRRASRQILCDGDVVMIGHCKYRFSMAASIATATGETHPHDEAPVSMALLGPASNSEIALRHH
jgi:chromosome segregation ATPase